MLKTKIIVGIIALVIALGGYQLVYKNNSDKSTQNTSGSETKDMTAQSKGKKMAFSQFVKQEKGAYKCEVKQVLSDMESKGTVYINNGDIRGDYTTIAEGREIDSHVIIKGGFSYNWSSTLPSFGVKIKIQTNETGNTETSTQGTYSWNAEQIGDYDCKEWTVDESMFTLPNGVTFNDFTS